MKYKILLSILLVAGVALGQAPIPLTIDSRSPTAPTLDPYQAAYTVYRVTFKDGTNAVSLTGLGPWMSWSTNSYSASVSTSTPTVINSAGGIVDFAFSAPALNFTPGRYIYEVGLRGGSGTVVYRQGIWTIRGSPYAAGAGNITWTTNVNWGLITWSGLPSTMAGYGIVDGVDATQMATVSGMVVTANGNITTLQTATNNLNTQITALKTSTNTLNSSLSIILTNYANIASTGALNTAVAALQVSTGTLNTAVSVLQTSTGNLNSAVSALQVNTGSLNTAVSALQSATNSMTARIAAGESATNNLQVQVAALQGATGTLNTATNTLQTQITALKTSTGTLNTAVTTLQTSTNSLQSQITTLQTASNSQTAAIAALQTSTNTLNTRMTAVEAATNALSTRMTAAETSTNNLNTRALALEIATNRLNTATNSLQTQATALQSVTGFLNTAVAALQTSTGTLNTAVSTLNAATNSMTVRIAATELATNALNTATNALNTRMTSAEAASNSLNTSVVALKSATNNLNTGVTALNAATNYISPLAANGQTAYGWGNHASYNYLSATQSIYSALTMGDRSKLTTNLCNLTASTYTGVIGRVAFTGYCNMAQGVTYALGFTKQNSYGTGTLAIGTFSLVATAAGAASNFFTPLATATQLVLTLDGTASEKSDASAVYVRQITNGNIYVAHDGMVGNNLYVYGDMIFPAYTFKAADALNWSTATNTAILHTGQISAISNDLDTVETLAALHTGQIGAISNDLDTVETLAALHTGQIGAISNTADAAKAIADGMNSRSSAWDTATAQAAGLNSRSSAWDTAASQASGLNSRSSVWDRTTSDYLTTSNDVSIVKTNYVQKLGDTMTGNLKGPNAVATNDYATWHDVLTTVGGVNTLYASTNKTFGIAGYYDARTFPPTHADTVITNTTVTNGEYLAEWISNTNLVTRINKGTAFISGRMRITSSGGSKSLTVKPELYIRYADTTTPELFEGGQQVTLSATMTTYLMSIDCSSNVSVPSDARLVVKYKAVTANNTPDWEFMCGSNLLNSCSLPSIAVVQNSDVTTLQGQMVQVQSATNALNTRVGNLETSTNTLNGIVAELNTNTLRLTGGIMSGPVSNAVGYYGNGGGLTNLGETTNALALGGVLAANYARTDIAETFNASVVVTNALVIGINELNNESGVTLPYGNLLMGHFWSGFNSEIQGYGNVIAGGNGSESYNPVVSIYGNGNINAVAGDLSLTNSHYNIILNSSESDKISLTNRSGCIVQGYGNMPLENNSLANDAVRTKALYLGGTNLATSFDNLTAATNSLNTRAGNLETSTGTLNTAVGNLNSATGSLNTAVVTLDSRVNTDLANATNALYNATNSLQSQATALQGATGALNFATNALQAQITANGNIAVTNRSYVWADSGAALGTNVWFWVPSRGESIKRITHQTGAGTVNGIIFLREITGQWNDNKRQVTNFAATTNLFQESCGLAISNCISLAITNIASMTGTSNFFIQVETW